MTIAVAGCGGGNDQTLSSEARGQRDQTSAVIRAQQSATQLMSAVVQPGSGTENFEAGMGDWQNWGNAQVVAGTGTAGSRAMQVGPAAGGAALQVPNVVGGTTYRLTAQVRATDPVQGPTTLGVDFYNAAGTRIIGTRAPSNITSTTFAAFSYDVTAPAGTAYALAWVWKNGSTGFAYVDDVTFGPASAPPPPPPPPSDSNLVSNGGFEAGMTGWTDWGNTQVVTGQANSGTSALSVGTAAGGAGYNVDGIVTGKTYRLGVSAKVSDASDKVYVGVNFVDAAGSLVTSTQRNTTSTTYTALSADIIAPTGAVRAVVYVWKDPGSGVAYVDDFTFGDTSGSTPPPPTGPNLLVNGTFENGLANWVNWGNATTSSQAAAGTSAAQVGTAAGGLGQRVSGIVPGNTYRVTAQGKVSGAGEIGYLGLKFMDAAGSSLQDAVVPVSSTSYASAQVELVAPPNASTALVYVWKNAGSGFAFLDQVELRGAGGGARFVGQPAEMVNTATAGNQVNPQVGVLPDGSYAVLWRQGDTFDTTITYGQKFDASGRRVGGELQVFQGGIVEGFLGLPDGTFVALIEVQNAGGLGTDVLLQRLDGVLTGIGAAQLVAGGGSPYSRQQTSVIDMDALPDGGFLATIHSLDPIPPASESNYLVRFNASGEQVGAPIGLFGGWETFGGASTTVLSDGGWASTFSTFCCRYGPQGDIRTETRYFDKNGVPTSAPAVLPVTFATALSAGGFLRTRTVPAAGDSANATVLAQYLDAQGQASGPEFELGKVQQPAGSFRIAALPNGGFVFVTMVGGDIYHRIFLPAASSP